MLRWISAFLFALTLLALSALGFWFYTVYRTEQQIQVVVPHMVGAHINYDSIQRHYVPGRVQLTLHNVVLKNDHMRYKLGDVLFESDFFGQYRLEMTFPKSQVLEVLEGGRPVQTYRIQMEKGMLQLYPDMQEIILSWLNLSLQDSDGERLNTGIADVSLQYIDAKEEKESQLVTAITLKEGRGQALKDGEPFYIPSFLFKGAWKRIPADWSESFLAVIKNPVQEELNALIPDIFQSMYDAKTELAIENWSYHEGERSNVIRGRVGVDSRLRPIGALELLFSQKHMFKEMIVQSGVLGPVDDALNLPLQEIDTQEQQAPYMHRVRMVRGELLSDGANLGVMAPLPEVFGTTNAEPVEMEPIGEETIPGAL